MKRLILMATTVVLLLGLGAPAALAADPQPDARSVLISANGSIDVRPGEHVGTLLVIDGVAAVHGDVGSIVVVNGTATLSGATAGSILVAGGSATLEAGTTVRGDIRTVNGTVTQAPGSVVGGSVRSLDGDLAAAAILLVPLLLLLFLGLGLAAIVTALLVAAFGARQVRAAESLITREPGTVLVTGIVGSVALPLAALALIMTVVGAPIGLGLLLVVLPAIAFLAWIIAAIWIGDWLVVRFRGAPEPDRPYRAAVLGVIVLAVAGVIPFVSTIATVFGFGALLLAALRVLRREGPGARETTTPTPGAVPA